MDLVKDKDVEDALQILGDERAASARAAHEYFDALTKTVLAELMSRCDEGSEAARDRWARSQPEYKDHLEKVGRFAKEAYVWRQRVSAAEAKIEIWRTQNANARAMERVR